MRIFILLTHFYWILLDFVLFECDKKLRERKGYFKTETEKQEKRKTFVHSLFLTHLHPSSPTRGRCMGIFKGYILKFHLKTFGLLSRRKNELTKKSSVAHIIGVPLSLGSPFFGYFKSSLRRVVQTILSLS